MATNASNKTSPKPTTRSKMPPVVVITFAARTNRMRELATVPSGFVTCDRTVNGSGIAEPSGQRLPAAHGVGEAEPAGQTLPTGQTSHLGRFKELGLAKKPAPQRKHGASIEFETKPGRVQVQSEETGSSAALSEAHVTHTIRGSKTSRTTCSKAHGSQTVNRSAYS